MNRQPRFPLTGRPIIIDFCCCSGGASMGYYRAGFDVVGVDIDPMPRYPFTFHQGDALELLPKLVEYYQPVAVVGSPPCQKSCAMTKGTNAKLGKEYPDLYAPMRDAFAELGLPAVIENPEARPDIVLCGEMFGLGVLRHRKFELINWSTPQPKHLRHRGRVRGYRHGAWYDGPYIAAYGTGGGKGTVAEMQQAMGIDWTDVRHELTESIPPAFGEYLGEQLSAHIGSEIAA